VAVKVFNLTKMHQPEIQKKHIEREIDALKMLKIHPNVVSLYHVTEQNGKLFLAFEYAEKGDLQ
jgi:serine/threonine protein kinase